ncbi:MAG: TIR domain-containing protein, partial [Chloroflexi bacterium]|nr:TIR domain-containing protein [Chloroflexota bacterium]
MTRRIFISYARADDEAFVLKLYNALKTMGFDPWYDRENMTNDGSPFTQAIGDAIRDCERLLFVVGPRSVASPYCAGEWKLALKLCKPVVPLLRLGDYNLIPPAIGKGHAIDCREARDYGAALNEIIRIISDPARDPIEPNGAPALPDWYIERPQYLEPLKAALRTGDPLLTITSRQESAALVGIGGIGKTTLAAALCLDCETRRTFDYIFWLEAGSNRRKADAPTLMYAVGSVFGDPSDPYQDLNSARAVLSNHLRGHKTLIVLDDVWDGGLVEAFQFGGVDCRLLITTRQKGIAGEHGQAVDKLNPTEGAALLNARAGRILDSGDAEAIVRLLDGHTLAITLAAAWLKSRPGQTSRDLLDDLRDGYTFDDLNMSETDKNKNLELSLRLSYDSLTDEQQARFRALGVLAADATFDAAAAGALWGDDPANRAGARKREATLALLLDAGLIETVTPAALTPGPLPVHGEGEKPDAVGAQHAAPDSDTSPRYGQHRLLRAYAWALLERAGESDAVFTRCAEHFITLAEGFNTLPPEAWGALEQDALNLQAVGDELVRQWRAGNPTPELADRCGRFASNITRYLANRREVRRLDWLEIGLEASRRAADSRREALFLNEIGLAWSALGEKRKALAYYEQALPLYRAVGDRGGEATTLNNIGGAWDDLGEKRQALAYYEQALPLYRAVGDRGGEATTLNNIGGAWD